MGDQEASDNEVLRELGRRLARARLERNLTQARLAEESGVSKRTVERMEQGAVATTLSALVRVLRALGALDRLDLLLPDLPPSPIAQLKLQGKTRRRARAPRPSTAPAKPWTWGDER